MFNKEYKDIQGGLSGKPLLKRSNEVLRQVSKSIGKDKTIIGVGGVDSSESANEKFNFGANLIQLYTGLVYKGPNIINEILNG